MKNALWDNLLALAVSGLVVVMLFVWPFPGLHPQAWGETAVAAGLLPQDRLLPGLGMALARLVFRFLPHDAALATVGIAAKVLVGVAAYLTYGIFSSTMRLMSSGGVRDGRRRLLAIRLAATVAAFVFGCADPLWRAAQGLSAATDVLLLFLLACWFYTRAIRTVSRSAAVMTLAAVGLLCAETPVGWLVLAAFAFLTPRYLAMTKDSRWAAFLDPILMQRTKWHMTFVFFGGLILGVSIDIVSFASAGGLLATGASASDLPMLYATSYISSVLKGTNLFGGGLLLAACVVPFLLAFLMTSGATDEERYLSFRHAIVFFVVGTIGFLQLSPFARAWFWNILPMATIPSEFVLLGVTLDAFAFALMLFVFGVEVLCRDYGHIESVLYRGYRDEDERPVQRKSDRVDERVTSVRLSFNRIVLVVVPFVLAGFVAWGRRLPEDRELQGLVSEAVDELVAEAKDVRYLFTDGAFDALLRLEIHRLGLNLRPISVMGGLSPREMMIREAQVSDPEDRLTLRQGATEALRTWTTAKSARLSESAVQLAFEIFRANPALTPLVYGLLVRPSGGDAETASAAVTRCHRLADRFVAIHDSGVWRHAKDATLKDLVLAVQFRLAVMARLRALTLDPAGKVREALAEEALADRLNARNPALQVLQTRTDWLRRQSGETLTPREGLDIALRRADFAMARRFAMPLLNQDPKDPEANFAVGMSYYVEGQYARSEKFLSCVLEKRPDDPVVLNNLALVYLKTDRLDRAAETAAKARAAAPDRMEIAETVRQIETARSAVSPKGR